LKFQTSAIVAPTNGPNTYPSAIAEPISADRESDSTSSFENPYFLVEISMANGRDGITLNPILSEKIPRPRMTSQSSSGSPMNSQGLRIKKPNPAPIKPHPITLPLVSTTFSTSGVETEEIKYQPKNNVNTSPTPVASRPKLEWR
jgi:hypothetical protein